MRTVAVVVTARPSYSRIRTALTAISDRDDLDLHLVLAGSALLDRYGSAVRQVESDGFSIDSRQWFVLEGENSMSMAKSTGLAIMELSGLFANVNPDLVVTVADRYETIATSIAAAYMNLPLVHIQGGEVSGSIDEKVRHANTKFADLHCVSTEVARRRVLSMGEDPTKVHMTGCPSIDIAAQLTVGDSLSFDLYGDYGGVGHAPRLGDGYLVMLQHPVTTEYRDAFEHATTTLNALESLDMPTLVFWPNVDAGSDGTSNAIRSFRETGDRPNFHFFKNVSPEHFLELLTLSDCLVGNSSVGIRECSYLGVPVVNIGSRQRDRERGVNVIDVPHDSDEITRAVRSHMNGPRPDRDLLYGDGLAGERIAAVLATSPLRTEKRFHWPTEGSADLWKP